MRSMGWGEEAEEGVDLRFVGDVRQRLGVGVAKSVVACLLCFCFAFCFGLFFQFAGFAFGARMVVILELEDGVVGSVKET